MTVIAALIALVGYDLIHAFERYLTYLTIVMLALLTVATFTHLSLPPAPYDLASSTSCRSWPSSVSPPATRSPGPSTCRTTPATCPPDVPARRTFQWTFWGSALGGIWVMLLGSCIALPPARTSTRSPPSRPPPTSLFPGFGAIALVIAALGLISVTALNMYGGSLTLISSVDSLRRIRPTLTLRIVTIGVTALISLVGANLASENFLANFSNFLLLVLYFFIPWTAVNLTDYFIVRKGHYAIAEIFEPTGSTDGGAGRGMVSYLVGFIVMVPFFSAGTLFVGPVAKAMQGADISMFIGLPVSAGLYWLLTRPWTWRRSSVSPTSSGPPGGGRP